MPCSASSRHTRCSVDVSERTIAGLDDVLREHEEADVVAVLARRLDLGAEEALELYFSSRIPELIAHDEYGVRYLSPEYLADEVLRERGL